MELELELESDERLDNLDNDTLIQLRETIGETTKWERGRVVVVVVV